MPKILVVCTANICRSPMAMVLIEHKLRNEADREKWVVESAGTWARDGLTASAFGRTIMAQKGHDLSAHRSRVVTKDNLADTDLVLTMEAGQKEALRAEFPDVADRVYLLSEMTGQTFDIKDPYGGVFEEYLETAVELETLIDLGLSRIVQLARAGATSRLA